MHIVLLILKIIGIVLLSLIGVLLALILLGLFVPIRYNIKGEKENKLPLKVDIRLNWLLHIVSFTLKYKEEASYRLRIFGITVLKGDGESSSKEEDLKEEKSSSKASEQKKQSNKEVKKQQKAAKLIPKEQKKSLEEQKCSPKADSFKKNQTEPQFASVSEDAQNNEQEIYLKQQINTIKTGKNKIEELWERICQFFIDRWRKVKELFYKGKQFIVDLCKKKDQAVKTFGIIKDFFCNQENKAGIRALWEAIKKLGKHCKPKKWNYKVHFGTSDPAQTGQILGIVSGIGGAMGIMPNIIPEFQEEVLEGDFFLKGKIQIYYLIWLVIAIWKNEDFQKLKHNFEKIRRNL